ncbi:hypothetical protein COCOBI_12-0730 [Coccomyxa sp. Obi]|nr:hypothetical protein COCOBI_12-0730 [Coccomyxa sp. Obi]
MLNHQLQQVVGAIRLKIKQDTGLGGVGAIFTDTGLHGVFFREDDEERERKAGAKCFGPAKSNGQEYRSGTALIMRAYKFAEGGPSAEAVLLALATYGKDLCEEAMGLRQPDRHGAKPPEQLGDCGRAKFMLQFSAVISGRGQVAGRMELPEILGEGGYGVVRRGILEGQEVAIKLPLEELEEESFAALEQEIWMHGCDQLKHLQGTAIARLIAAGTAATMSFLAIELLGPSAADVDVPPLTPEQEDAAVEALMQLHKAGMVHGDPRAENLLMPREGFGAWAPKWADLSLAMFSDDPNDHAGELEGCISEIVCVRGLARQASLRRSFPRAALKPPQMCAMPNRVRFV